MRAGLRSCWIFSVILTLAWATAVARAEEKKPLKPVMGGTKASERAIAAGLNWLGRHQQPEGQWTFAGFTEKCNEPKCGGAGQATSDAAATGLALLSFLAAGQVPNSKGPYGDTIKRGFDWLIQGQKPDGDLTRGHPGGSFMYAQGIASITLCEAYGQTADKTIGEAAQKAVDFIEKAQNRQTGGWRYMPGDEGDTSVFGWQITAIRSAQLAKLKVQPETMDRAKRWLSTVAKGEKGGLFVYLPAMAAGNSAKPTPAMTAIGLLGNQVFGMKADDPAAVEGAKLLLANLPADATRNTYYWFHATHAMHNRPGPDWDQWNRQLRRTLVESQCKEGCAAGSWDPAKPTPDMWGQQGGRLFTTTLSLLSLEIYYRYLGLFKAVKE